jgi:hypothetical protein
MILENNRAEKQVRVRVIDRWRVVHPDNGDWSRQDDVLVVAEHVAKKWERSGYIERVTGND